MLVIGPLFLLLHIHFVFLVIQVALEYGVISDIAQKVINDEPIELGNACFNCIWQGDANEAALRCLLHASSPAMTINVTGPEIAGVRYVAEKLGELLGKTPSFTGTPGETAYLENSCKAISLLGYPSVSLETMIEYQAQWIKDGGKYINKPTHFEEKKGVY